MKKLIIYFLCIIIAFQNCIGAYAAETELVTEQTGETEQLEIEEPIEEEEEQAEAEEPTKEEEEQAKAEEPTEEEEKQAEAEESTEEEEEQAEAEEPAEEEEEPSETVELAVEEEPSEENVEDEQYQDDEDPQFGREQGYLSEGFLEAQAYSLETEDYAHNSRFDGYTIKEVIDVSKYQGDIDWNEVKNSGIDYAIIRAGFRGYGESGALKTDDYYKKNIQGALNAGLEVGVYIFSQAITEKEAQEEAEYVLELIKGYDVSLPVVIDYEYASSGNGLTGRLYNADLSKSAATKICRKFCATILNQGYTPMVYANKSMLENSLNASDIAKDYKIWLANYTTSTSYQGEYEFWQYTQTGTVTGIYGNVDKSFWYITPEKNVEIENVSVSVDDTLAERIYGETRYETCFKIAEMLKRKLGVDKFDNVIVASGENFADALSGSYLASKKGAPILLTRGKNAQDVKDYIKKNLKAGGTVYILGGTAALPEGVGCGLKDFHVKRLWGATRYETNIEILKEAGVDGKEILVCGGKTFADSLSCSAMERPILLVGSQLTEVQKEFLSSLSGNKIYIIGGESAISSSIEKEIKKYGTTQRIGGATRYETSTLVAEEFFDSPSSVVLAYSHNFPDGLCGGPLAISIGSPLKLTKPGYETTASEYAKENGIYKGYVLGGPSFVTDSSVGKILGRISEMENAPTAEFASAGNGEYRIEYQAILSEKNSADNYYYLLQADSYEGRLIESPIAVVEKNIEIFISTVVSEKSQLNKLVMNKLVLAVKLSDGSYQAVNKPVFISNPEMIAENKSEIFKASSKKGLQGVAFADDATEVTDARYTNTKQTLFNLDLATVVGTGPSKGYVEYQYKGNTYYFSDCSALKESIQTLNSGYQQYLYGNDETTKVAVSLCLLLSYNKNTSYLIDPAARTSGHTYYMLNVQEKKARETFEALFLYLGEIFGQEDCYVTNWILGNEVNSSKAWNYSGKLSFENYMQRYATAFQILYNGVKAHKAGNTVSISLDNGWNAVPDTYAGKATLDQFAKNINALNPNIEWSIAYHAYSYPLTRADFWNISSTTTDSTSTKYISMKNIDVLTNYAASLEKTYDKPSGSIRVLLTEQGYSYSSGAKTQATAIARAYYTAEFNDRIDAFIIRALVDSSEETSDGLYLGLMNVKTEKRSSFYVYEYMDSDLEMLRKISAQGTVSSANYENFNSAKDILCNTNWKSIIPGFDSSKLAQIK